MQNRQAEKGTWIRGGITLATGYASNTGATEYLLAGVMYAQANL
jgi:hypothetical protein